MKLTKRTPRVFKYNRGDKILITVYYLDHYETYEKVSSYRIKDYDDFLNLLEMEKGCKSREVHGVHSILTKGG